VALGLSVLTGLLFGLAPALRATRVDLTPSLKQVSAGSVWSAARAAPVRMRLSQMLVVAQVALSLLLLVAAGLFLRTLSNLHAIELGFNRENVLLLDVNPRAAGYKRPALNRLYGDLMDRLGQIPGVRAVSMANRPLLSGSGSYALVNVPGVDPPAGATPSVKAPASPGDLPANMAGVFVVGPRFFETMQIPLISGREFQERDGAGAPQVAVVNQQFVALFGLENPVGRTLTLGRPTSQYEIVGVVGDALFLSLKEDPRPMVYVSSLIRTPEQATYLVRAAGNPLDHANTVRKVVHQIDPRLAVSNLKTQAAHINQAISREITLARLCTIFALLALVIACVGLYGTVAFSVERRTAEIGIRTALGAQRPRILWLVLRDVFLLGLAGLAVGMPAVVVGSRYVESFLFGIEPNDPLVTAIAVVVLLAAALIAGYVPARRASRIDPMVALRHE
jgi:predicted permease